MTERDIKPGACFKDRDGEYWYVIKVEGESVWIDLINPDHSLFMRSAEISIGYMLTNIERYQSKLTVLPMNIHLNLKS